MPHFRFLAAFAVGLFAAAGSCDADADSGPAIEIRPAWNGAVRAGAATELGVRLETRIRGTFVIEVTGGQTPVTATMPVAAATPETVWIPVQPVIGHPLTVRFRSTDGDWLPARHWTPDTVGRRRVVALAFAAARAPTLSGDVPDAPLLINVGPQSLPHTLSGYGVVAVLAMDVPVFLGLAPDQVNALQQYLAGCGKVALVDMPRAMGEAFVRAAGCDGRYLRFVNASGRLAETLVDLAATDPPRLPGASALRALSAPGTERPATAAMVVAFVVFYLTAMALAAVVTRSPVPLLVLPLTGAILSLVAWYDRPPHMAVTTWFTAGTANASARYSAILETDGAGLGTARVAMAATSIPVRFPRGAAVYLTRDEDGRRRTVLEFPTKLLSRGIYEFRGTAVVPRPVALSIGDDGPVIANTGSRRSAPGVVKWGLGYHRVPPLTPGERWVLPASAPAIGPGTLERSIGASAGEAPAAFLVATETHLPHVTAGSMVRRSWLLLTAGAGGQRGRR